MISSVNVYDLDGKAVKQAKVPAVFNTSIRPDLVESVFTRLSKNTRQAHGVSVKAGHQHSAESWGPGRAVARVPRVSGGGTHRAGQGAFANSCRKGRMFAPIKTFRKIHQKVSKKERRFAIASGIAASAQVGLVMARGHKIEEVPFIPYVFTDSLQNMSTTKEAMKFIKDNNIYQDVKKVSENIKNRPGKGKLRNRRKIMRKGPLIVYSVNHGIRRAFRNIPGVQLINVHKLALDALAPGSHLGRFIIWSQSAFSLLDSIYKAKEATNYVLSRPVLSNPNITKIIQSKTIQFALRPKKPSKIAKKLVRQNPLKNKRAYRRLNPLPKKLSPKRISKMSDCFFEI